MWYLNFCLRNEKIILNKKFTNILKRNTAHHQSDKTVSKLEENNIYSKNVKYIKRNKGIYLLSLGVK